MKYQLLFFITLCISILSCAPEESLDETIDEPRSKYLGKWLCYESSQEYSNSTYAVNIVIDSLSENSIYLTNFYHLGYDKEDRAFATTLDNKISIPQQIICNRSIEGSGELNSDDEIHFKYIVNDGADIDSCTAIFKKE